MSMFRSWLFMQMLRLSRRGLLNFIPDIPYLKIQYYLKLGERLDLKRPTLYNEKLQWLKLYDRDLSYSGYVDKIAARGHVGSIIGDAYLIPAIAQYESVDEIDWDALPNRFVLKCTHGSSCNIICRDKNTLDIENAKKQIAGWMRRNWFDISREWPYKHIRPRILIEEFLESDSGDVPYDYKIMCFEGKPTYIVVDVDRYTGHKRNYYDTEWRLQGVVNRHPNYEGEVPRPEKLSEMLGIAERLSEGFHHIRIDLYVVGDRVYFGEMTFFHGYGMESYCPRSFERHMGDLIQLPLYPQP